MNRLSRMVAGLALMGMLAVVSNSMSADDKVPTIKELMSKSNEKDTGLLAKIGKQLEGDKPDWDAIIKESKEYADLSVFLIKGKPPRGDQASWEKLSKQYEANAKALLTSAEKKDQKATKEAQEKLTMGCRECHMAHKMKK